MPPSVLRKVTCLTAGDGFHRSGERLVRESSLTIRINGRPYAVASILPDLTREFVIGHLFTQGLIGDISDITSLEVGRNTAEVTLRRAVERPGELSPVGSVLKVHPQQIFNCVSAILGSKIFAETEAVHSAGLFLEGKEPVCITEDIGRQNALDKAIGCGLVRGIDLRRTVAASTGRQPAEMVVKCARAGIPVIATKGVATSLAVALADRLGITIAGLVRGSTMTVYSHPERIEVYHVG